MARSITGESTIQQVCLEAQVLIPRSDVVDTKPVHSNVGAMFYGAVDLTSDRLGEQFGPPLCGNP